MSRTMPFYDRMAKRHELPFMELVEGLERYIGGKEFSAPKGATASVRRFFLQAYEWARHHGNLPQLGDKYQVLGSNRRPEIAIPSMFKFKELYEKITGRKELDERQVGLAAVKLLGLLDNLEENQDLKKRERKKYKPLLKFGRTLLRDPECQEPHRYSDYDE